MKKIISLLLAIVMVSAVLAIGGFVTKSPTQAVAETEVKGVDVYFIAGQSNAAGCSDFYRYEADPYKLLSTYNLSGEWLTKAKSGLYTNGFSNVFYYGNAYGNTSKNSGTQVTELTPVKAGGMASAGQREIGAELGMAEYLNSRYTGNRKAVIIKYAVGAASLLGEQGADWGSWCAPSYATAKSISIFGEDFYHNMLGNEGSFYGNGVVMQALEKIYQAGYKDVEFKGFYWSQGEAECNSSDASKHGDALKAFINDVRKDLNYISEFAERKYGLDVAKAENMPFLISEICPTFANSSKNPDGTSSNGSINTVVSAQREVAKSLANTYTLPTTNYTIVDNSAKMSSTVEGVSYCGDKWHYNADDMLDIGNQVAKKLFTLGTGTANAEITVKAKDQYGNDASATKVSLVGAHSFDATIVDGVAKFNNLPAGSYEIVVDGFNAINGKNEYVKGQTVALTNGKTATKSVNVYENPIKMTNDAYDYFNVKRNQSSGTSITASQTPAKYIDLNGENVTGIKFKLNWSTNDNTTYFPHVYAVDQNGTLAGLQFCIWGKSTGFKAFVKNTQNKDQVQNSVASISSVAGKHSADVSIWFDGTRVYWKITNLTCAYTPADAINGSFDLAELTQVTTFAGAKRIVIAYNNDVGKSGSFSGKGEAGSWSMFDIAPITEVSTSKSTVTLNVVGKNIRGSNGVSDANLNNKTLRLLAVNGNNQYSATVRDGKVSLKNVPYGKYKVTVDDGNYLGEELLVVNDATIQKTVRVNYKLFINDIANVTMNKDGMIAFGTNDSHLYFNRSLYPNITYVQAILSATANEEKFVIGFAAIDQDGSRVDFGLRYRPKGHEEYKGGPLAEKTEWLARVSSKYWNQASITGTEDTSKVTLLVKAWIENGTVNLVVCNAETGEALCDVVKSEKGYESFVAIVNPTTFATSVEELIVGDSIPDPNKWVEDDWVNPDDIVDDNGSNDNNNGTVDGENNVEQNQQAQQGCMISSGTEIGLISVFAIVGACLICVRKLKSKEN